MITVVGHRGAAGLAPENTLPSFLKAAELGAAAVELDAHLTRDGIPVCIHDARLDRLTAARGRVADWNWEALRSIPVLPGAFSGAFADARIPRLSEVLDALSAPCQFLVELKPESERGEVLVREVVQIIRAAGAVDRCRLISFDHDLLRFARATGWGSGRLGVLVERRAVLESLVVGAELRAEAVHVPHAAVDAGFSWAAHQAGFLVNAWTVNEPDDVRRLIALGVDEIATDYPDVVLAVAGGA